MILRLLSSMLLVAGLVSGQAVEIDFTRDIRPILSENCFHCHGPDANAREGDLRLDDEADVKRERDGYRLLHEGDSDASELLFRLITDDPDDLMPPPKSNRTLTDAEIGKIRDWIDQGAKWGTHWAFERVEKPTPPNQEIHPIDAFIERRLGENGISPNPIAPAHTRIRRLSLDTTGLPPTVEDVDAFVRNETPQAWEQQIDRYLDSAAFGERMAWDWLNAARYADSNGYQGDRERTMWPWRDWVVSAFQNNMPYDQFTIWQLGGDLLPNATEEQILATGFNRNHMINGEGGRIPEENRVEYTMDMSETVGTVWLGLTMNCCRCHDHKFDPLTQKDYFAFLAFFNQTPVTGGGGDPQTKPVLAVATDAQKAREKELVALHSSALDALRKREKDLAEGQLDWEKRGQKETDWQTWTPANFSAEHQKLRVLEDGSILAEGPLATNDTYRIEGPLDHPDITAIRVEALQDDSLTGTGLARSDSGNFVLTEIEILINGSPVEIGSAEASYAQGGFPVTNAFDDNNRTGWAVHRGKAVDRPEQALFRLKFPIQLVPDTSLEVTLRHDSVHPHHHLGRFKLSLTSDPKPRLSGGDPKLQLVLDEAPSERSKEEAALVLEAFRASDPTHRQLKAALEKAKTALENHRKTIPKVMVMEDLPKPRQTFILDRGLYNQPKEPVFASVPKLFPQLPAEAKADRLALSQWLVSRDNPLTARVTVNRIWQMIFGIGLIKTVEDFGVQAEVPKHPELLDWLAAEFMDSGWDVKHLLKLILTSEVYQRSSAIPSRVAYEADPDNRWLSRGPRFRMPSWMIRDQALAASGLLNAEVGGPSFNGYQPPGIWEEATFGKKTYAQVTGDELYRRSLYVFWRRIVGPTMFFDSANRQICEVKPTRTNTPMHALSTLNDVTYVEAARHLAERAINAAESDDARLQFAGTAVLGREPNASELLIWQRGLNRARNEFSASPEEALHFVENGNSTRNSSLEPVEHAAFASVCLMLLNLDETLTKE